MRSLRDDLKQYDKGGIGLLVILCLVATPVLSVGVIRVFGGGYESIAIWLLLALILAVTSSNHPLKFFSTGTGTSMSEAFTFLAAIMLGPSQAALLAAVDMSLVCRRLRLRSSLYPFNVANHSISIYLAGSVYYTARIYLEGTQFAVGPSEQRLAVFAAPLVAMALTGYLLQFLMLGALTHLTRRGKTWDRLKGTFPWEPVSFVVGALAAGLISHSLIQYGPWFSGIMIGLALPVLVTIYYNFKNYHDKVREQESHYEELTGIYDSILEMLAMAIDAKDDVTHDHIQRVRLFARRMGELTGLSELEIEALKAGALLHDIGKIGVPTYILNKPGKLSEHEFEQMKMHTIIGADMLSNVKFRYPVVPIVRHHHERWDGRGYPDGLKGEQIPITARILTLVDNYDALRSDRPYKRGMTREEALTYIKENAGTFFDPKLVETFLSVADDMEAEASTVIAAPEKKNRVESSAMASAKPAAGFESAPKVDRAAAALFSIAETNQRVTALYEIARTLSSILSVEDTVALLANRLSKLIPFTTCAISLFDASRSEFEIVHATGHHAERFTRRRQPAEAGITGYVITNQRAMYNTNAVLDLGFLGHEFASQYKGVMIFPLVKNNEPLGAIALYSTEIESYGAEHIQLMESISQPASDAVFNALTFDQTERDALTDPVTGLANMRVLASQFYRDRARSQRRGTSVAVMVVRLNNLEEDAARSASSDLLTSMGLLIKEQLRETDMVGRHSATSFTVLLPDSGRDEARRVHDRIRMAMVNAGLANSLSVGIGWAVSPEDGNTMDEVLQAAHLDSIAGEESMKDLIFIERDDNLSVLPV
jgi:diguanylate cyclase (GGDEF)-like protein/putative nucleotidyltransferase with HDIG domain